MLDESHVFFKVGIISSIILLIIMKRLVLAFFLVLAVMAFSEDDESSVQARQDICKVLSNVRNLMSLIMAGSVLIVYLPLLGVILLGYFIVEDEGRKVLIKKLSIIALAILPLIIFGVVGLVFLVTYLFSGGSCLPIPFLN